MRKYLAYSLVGRALSRVVAARANKFCRPHWVRSYWAGETLHKPY